MAGAPLALPGPTRRRPRAPEVGAGNTPPPRLSPTPHPRVFPTRGTHSTGLRFVRSPPLVPGPCPPTPHLPRSSRSGLGRASYTSPPQSSRGR